MTWKENIKKKNYAEIQDKIEAMLEENDTLSALDLAMRTLGGFTDGFFGDIHDIIRKEVGEKGLKNMIEAIAFGY